MGEIAEALQRSAVGRALFAITTGSLTKGTSGEVTKFPNDMKLGRTAGVRASCEGGQATQLRHKSADGEVC